MNWPEGARPSLSRTAPKYFAPGSGTTLRPSPLDDKNDWMNSAMLEASGPASSTTPFFGCAVAISARVAATSSAATGWNLGRRHIDFVPLRSSVCDRIKKLEELRRAQHRVRDTASFDQPFLHAFCTQIPAFADAIRAEHREGDDCL